MVRKFLYLIAFLAILVIAGGFALSIWSRELTEIALVPSTEFVEQDALADNAYNAPDMWFSRPGIGTSDPARWQPAIRGEGRSIPAPADQSPPDFAVFFVHPTSYYSRSSWNAALDDEEATDRARLFVRGLASPFNQAEQIWAPRYRQATLGAFLTEEAVGQEAFEFAYRDVEAAFDHFLAQIDEDIPIVLAGHSQGALHTIMLLHRRIADTPLANRIAAAYPIGWPISETHDLPFMGLPACTARDQSGCIQSWASYAEPADPSQVERFYRRSKGLDGQSRGTSPILCTNPLTGMRGGAAPMSANLGTLVPEDDFSTASLVPRAVSARCDPRGILLIGDPPEMGQYVLPGNDYHVYDIPLFWANLRADVAARVSAFTSQSAPSE